MEENNEEKVVEVKEETVTEAKAVYKKHGPLYWIIVIAGMAFIVFMSVRIGEKLAESKEPSSSSNSKVETTSNNTSDKEEQKTELTQADKEKIANKLAKILGDSEYTYGKVITTSDLTPTPGNAFTSNFNESNRLLLLFKSLKPTGEKIDVNSINVKDTNIAQMIKEEPTSSAMLVFNGEEVAKAYKELYGTDMTYADVNSCPGYYYDSNSKNYISIGGCGGASTYKQYVYVDEITAQDNSIVISTYVGSVYSTPEGETYYNDYLTSFDNITAQKTTEKEITSSNKTSFTKYNFTFEKASDGEYYYKSVVKAN